MDVVGRRLLYDLLKDLVKFLVREKRNEYQRSINLIKIKLPHPTIRRSIKLKNLIKVMAKLLPVAVIFATLILAACTPGQTVSSICHATGDVTNPYEEITVDANSVGEHQGHTDDFWPVPVNGCPTTPVTVIDGKITICHATSSETNPYNEISIDRNGLNGHDKHEDDMIPAPESGCPSSLADTKDGKITICHSTNSEKNPYNEITVSVNGLNGHSGHSGDIIPAPAGGCPTS